VDARDPDVVVGAPVIAARAQQPRGRERLLVL
jgi:hypothetical protein